MNKLIVFNLVIYLFLCLDYAYLLPPVIPKEKLTALRDLVKCSHQKCETEHNAFRELFKTELDECLKKCGLEDLDLKASLDEGNMKLRNCFREKNCKTPSEQMRSHRDSEQFKVVKKCSEEKCAEEFKKLKHFGGEEF